MSIAQEKMSEIVDKLITKIENNETGLWSKSWISGNRLPSNFASKSTYSGFNILSLMMMIEENNWTSNQFLTFNQIKKIKGASLKKGSLSTPVFFFKMIDKTEIVNNEEVEKKIPLLKFFYVYNLDQVSGIELGSDKDKNIDLNDFVFNSGVKVKTRPSPYYSLNGDYIGIPELKMFDSVEAYGSTILHELAHATGSENRLNRDMSGSFEDEEYAFEECVAELSSIFLCNHLNIEGQERQAEAYIKGWLINGLKANPKLLWKISSEAQKVFNYLVALQADKVQVA